MIEALVLRHLNFSKVFEVAYDATGVGIRGVLSKDGYHIAYFSENSLRLNNDIPVTIKSFMQWCNLFIIDVIICCLKNLFYILIVRTSV